ncbi:MAG: chemotaxis protein CheD [Blastomonas sp.]
MMHQDHRTAFGAVTRITLLQGEARVSSRPDVEISTILGSCVACCLFDPLASVGGMNHFLLAEPKAEGEVLDEHYGVYLMEVLINDMMKKGANRSNLRARLYGGANLHPGMRSIGLMNAEFADKFLESERIPLMHAELGGTQARRLSFMPASGKVRSKLVPEVLIQPSPAMRRTQMMAGDVELF